MRAIKNNNFLSDVELEEIEREIMMEENNGTVQESNEMNESGEEMHSDNLRGEGRNTDRTASDFAIGETVSDEEKEILKLIKEKMENPNSLESVNLRAMDRKKVKEKLEVVNEVIDKVISRDITDTNRIILAASNVVADLVGMKKGKKKNETPMWKMRLLRQIAEMRKDVSRVEKWKKGKLKSEGLKDHL